MIHEPIIIYLSYVASSAIEICMYMMINTVVLCCLLQRQLRKVQVNLHGLGAGKEGIEQGLSKWGLHSVPTVKYRAREVHPPAHRSANVRHRYLF